jgi:hypothetical protein
MQSRRTHLWALTALLASSLLFSFGCKEEAPSGGILPAKVETKVGETTHLELTVRSRYEAVQREMWKVEPEELGDVYFDQAAVKRRTATFRAKTAGTGKIVVYGFLADPKPYRLAEVPVTVE